MATFRHEVEIRDLTERVKILETKLWIVLPLARGYLKEHPEKRCEEILREEEG
mgnify:CR=1 FL=1